MDLDTALTTFGLIFLAELGDKTQLAVLMQSCKYRSPWAVFLGASMALILVTALGTTGGRLAGSIVPDRILKSGAAIMFIVMGALIAREAIGAEKEDTDPSCQVNECRGNVWRAFVSTFWLLCVAEMGDKTQLAVLGLAARNQNPFPVFAGGATALIAVTALGVLGGEGLCRLLPRRALLWLSGALFVGIGVWLWLG